MFFSVAARTIRALISCLIFFFFLQSACESGHGKDGFQLDDQERLQDPRDSGAGEYDTRAAGAHLLPAD